MSGEAASRKITGGEPQIQRTGVCAAGLLPLGGREGSSPTRLPRTCLALQELLPGWAPAIPAAMPWESAITSPFYRWAKWGSNVLRSLSDRYMVKPGFFWLQNQCSKKKRKPKPWLPQGYNMVVLMGGSPTSGWLPSGNLADTRPTSKDPLPQTPEPRILHRKSQWQTALGQAFQSIEERDSKNVLKIKAKSRQRLKVQNRNKYLALLDTEHSSQGHPSGWVQVWGLLSSDALVLSSIWHRERTMAGLPWPLEFWFW